MRLTMLPALLLVLLPLALVLLATPLHPAHAQCTLTQSGTQVTLSNTLVSVTINTATADTTGFLYYPSGSGSTPIDFLGNNGYANFDRTTDTYVRPSRLRMWIIQQTSTLIYIRLRQVSTDTIRIINNFDWDFHFVIKAGVAGIYKWTTMYHGAQDVNGTVGVLRYIMRLNPGTAPNYNDAPLTHVWIPPNMLREQPTYGEASNGQTLWPQEAFQYTHNGQTLVHYKYDYSLDNRFHDKVAWINPSTKVGLWLLSPSLEYKNGGPDGQSLTSAGNGDRTHMQVVNSPHYGSGDQLIDDGEVWYKVYGPWLVYANKKSTVDALISDAQSQLQAEQALWPYDFVPDSFYAAANRFTVSGHLVVSDSGGCPGATAAWLSSTRSTLGMTWGKTMVYLVAPEAVEGRYTFQSKSYTYFAYTDDSGNFVIPDVVAGTYEIHAWSDGYIGEYTSPTTYTLSTSASSSRTLNVGTLTYTVPRNAPTLWQVGFPDRTAREYKHGDDYRHWGQFDLFATDFPNGINYQIGSNCLQPASQWRSQLNYAHLPVDGNATTWTFTFNVPAGPTIGTYAYLRVAVAGSVGSALVASINGGQIGYVNGLPSNDMSTYRSGIHGLYNIRVIRFATSRLSRTSPNTLTLWNRSTGRGYGLEYDAIQLEVEGWSW